MLACAEPGAPVIYHRREPEKTVLYQCVEKYWPTLLAHAEQADRPVPDFVRREFENYLLCGRLEEGFVRVRCPTCGFDRLVAFSCKSAICPSCCGRRMAEFAAHLVDEVLPPIAMRQWVLTFPPPLRYSLAYDSRLCSEVLGIFIGRVFAWLRHRAKSELGLRRLDQAQPGAIVALQRFGSAGNLNLHCHALVSEGVFVADNDTQSPTFHPLPAPTQAEIQHIAWTTCERVVALLRKRGQWLDADPETDKLAQDEPLLSSIYSASITGTLAMGPRAGKRLLRLVDAPVREADGHDGATRNGYGFDLNAGVRVAAHDRKGLERLCRYLCRPAISNERVKKLPDGNFALALKRPWANGTSAIVLSGEELIEKLVALVPPPRFHMTRAFGVFASHAKLRPKVIPKPKAQACEHDRATIGAPNSRPKPSSYSWDSLMMRVFAIDVLRCERCGSRMQKISVISQPAVIRAILAAVGRNTGPPPPALAPCQVQLPLRA